MPRAYVAMAGIAIIFCMIVSIALAQGTIEHPVATLKIAEVQPIVEFAKPTGTSEVAFYIAPEHFADSLVVSTEGETSETGFRMTKPDGTEVHNVEHLADTKLLDVLHNFRFRDGTYGDIIGALDENEQLHLYRVHPTARKLLHAVKDDAEFENKNEEEKKLEQDRQHLVEQVAARDIVLRSALSNSKAMSSYISHVTGEGYFFIATKGGVVLQVLLHEDDEVAGKIDASVLRTFKHGVRIDALETDHDAGLLYLGDGNGAIWAYDAEPTDPNPAGILVDKPSPENGEARLFGRVTGISLYPIDDTHSFLVVYTMKNNQFSVYSVEHVHHYQHGTPERHEDKEELGQERVIVKKEFKYEWRTGFSVIANEQLNITGPSKVKGFDITNLNINPEDPRAELGLLAVAYKSTDNKQSIKLVSWKDIAVATGLEKESRSSTHNLRGRCENCHTPRCPLMNNCNNRGRCLAPTECACYAGWGGATCDEFNCADVNQCGQGQCVGPNHCQCNEGWAGAGCNLVKVRPTVETSASGADADDPAIWIHPTDPSKSTILGTTKTHEAGGLRVFNTKGTEVEFHPVGHANSVDVIYEFPFTIRGRTIFGDLAVVGSRETNEVVIFSINQQTGRLEGIVKNASDPSALKEPARIPAGGKIYGSCDYRSNIDGKYYVFVTTKRGELLQHEIFWEENTATLNNNKDETGLNGDIKSTLVRRFMVGGKSRDKDMRPSSIVEGCVADHELGVVYFSEEAVGIWKYQAEPSAPSDYPVLVDHTDPVKGGHLSADVEGLTIFDSGNGNGYLIASIQGIDGFAVLEREGNNKFLFSFIIGKGLGNIDEVTHTDGIAVTAASLGPHFPYGVFVAHDDINTEETGTTPHATYKMVPWHYIAMAPGIPAPLAFNPAWNPRKYHKAGIGEVAPVGTVTPPPSGKEDTKNKEKTKKNKKQKEEDKKAAKEEEKQRKKQQKAEESEKKKKKKEDKKADKEEKKKKKHKEH